MKPEACSGRTLAFLGDAVWSLLVREHLIENGRGKGSTLQKESIHYVSARAQASFYSQLHEASFFTADEEETYKRGRNSNAGSVPHSTPVAVYRSSTGFEAILGALYLEKNEKRIRQIWDTIRTMKER